MCPKNKGRLWFPVGFSVTRGFNTRDTHRFRPKRTPTGTRCCSAGARGSSTSCPLESWGPLFFFRGGGGGGGGEGGGGTELEPLLWPKAKGKLSANRE